LCSKKFDFSHNSLLSCCFHGYSTTRNNIIGIVIKHKLLAANTVVFKNAGIVCLSRYEENGWQVGWVLTPKLFV